jgi:hypothetical protein
MKRYVAGLEPANDATFSVRADVQVRRGGDRRAGEHEPDRTPKNGDAPPLPSGPNQNADIILCMRRLDSWLASSSSMSSSV